MRLQAVREQDPVLDLVLKLAALIQGSFTTDTISAVFRQHTSDHDVKALAEALSKGVRMRMLKFLSSSGATISQDRQDRRRSTAVDTTGRWAFHHLEVERTVHEMLLAAEARQMHETCAMSLDVSISHVPSAPSGP